MSREPTLKIAILLSGGVDSSTMALLYSSENFDIYPLFVDYGQNATVQEWSACSKVCNYLEIENLTKINISSLRKLRGNLLNRRLARNDSYFFPFRNLILASIGALFAYGIDCYTIGFAIIGAGSPSFPDCSQKFLDSLSKVLSLAVDLEVNVCTPFINLSKTEVVCYGLEHDFPYELTYSCYRGGSTHCGTCPACQNRKAAFRNLNADDPTRYDQ